MDASNWGPDLWTGIGESRPPNWKPADGPRRTKIIFSQTIATGPRGAVLKLIARTTVRRAGKKKPGDIRPRPLEHIDRHCRLGVSPNAKRIVFSAARSPLAEDPRD